MYVVLYTLKKQQQILKQNINRKTIQTPEDHLIFIYIFHSFNGMNTSEKMDKHWWYQEVIFSIFLMCYIKQDKQQINKNIQPLLSWTLQMLSENKYLYPTSALYSSLCWKWLNFEKPSISKNFDKKKGLLDIFPHRNAFILGLFCCFSLVKKIDLVRGTEHYIYI